MIPGEKVHVIGNPLSQYCSYGSGEVSQIRSNYEWSYDEFYRDLKAEVIQTNAPILSGNSGGPMFNKGGNLIGINTFVYEDKLTLNFAVSINEVVFLLVTQIELRIFL